jgi:hypothetical protein
LSTRESSPGLSLLVFVGVAVVAGWIAATVLGYLDSAGLGGAPSWWVPLLGIGMPVVVIVAIVLYLYLTS